MKKASEHESISEQPIFALEEQLARQKRILASKLVQKLPDKGAKLRDSVQKIEGELERRRKEASKLQVSVTDVGKLEWALGARPTTGDVREPASTGELDSDDDAEAVGGDEEVNDRKLLQIIATSQVSQRQPKQTVNFQDKLEVTNAASEVSGKKSIVPDAYVEKLIEKEAKKEANPSHGKFLPWKSLKEKPAGSRSPGELSSTSVSSSASSENRGKIHNKWDECLLPPNHCHEVVKLLSMEETLTISCDKYKQAEAMKNAAQPKKVYAYERLQEQGLLGNYTVKMQTSRPVKPDYDDDEQEEHDLSDDQITEDSESGDSDDDVEATKTSKDLSDIVNTSLKLS